MPGRAPGFFRWHCVPAKCPARLRQSPGSIIGDGQHFAGLVASMIGMTNRRGRPGGPVAMPENTADALRLRSIVVPADLGMFQRRRGRESP